MDFDTPICAERRISDIISWCHVHMLTVDHESSSCALLRMRMPILLLLSDWLATIHMHISISRAAISIRHYISYVCRWCNSSFVYRYDADAHHNNNNNSLLPIYLSTLHREASPTAIALAMAILANLASTDMMVNRARSLSPNHQKLPRPIQKARSCLLQNHHLNQVLTSKDPFWQRSTMRPVVLIGMTMRVGWEKKMSANGMGLLVMTHHWLQPLSWVVTDSLAPLLMS